MTPLRCVPFSIAESAPFSIAVDINLFSRRIVGWAMQPTMTAQLVTDALTMAVWRRDSQQNRQQRDQLHHSDRGRQLGLNWSSPHGL